VEDNNLLSSYPQRSYPGGVQSAGAQISTADATTTHLDDNVVYPYSPGNPEERLPASGMTRSDSRR